MAGSVSDRGWFARAATTVAPDLLGAYLVHRTADGTVALRITEVEAYDGANDPGSHAFRGWTARNATMFGPPGHLYVYRHLGLHHCVNIVCGPAGRAAAVLLRGGEVIAGADLALARRRAAGVCRTDRELARGPARLTVALGISLADDGADLLAPIDAGGFALFLPLTQDLMHPQCADTPRSDALPTDAEHISTGPRVGIAGEGGRADLFPWRFWLTNDPTVSAYRAAPAPRSRP